MINLLISSKDAIDYVEHIERAKIADLSIQICPKDPALISDAHTIDVVLGEPNLCIDVLPHCPNVKWIQSTWAGIKPFFDSAPHDFKLTGVKDIFGPQMREYVFSYLLYFARRIQTFKDLQTNRNWTQPLCAPLQGKTIGILGMGSIGTEIAKTAKHFGMHVIGIAQNIRQLDFVDEFYQLNQLQEFAHSLDYLVVLLPHTDNTEKLIDKGVLSLLNHQCILINAGRGQVIDENALLHALSHNQLQAAVLDVFIKEPLAEDHPFWGLDNLYITQHTAAISKPDEISKIFLQNLRLFNRNEKLINLIDWEKGY
ncbi:D-2-hydroxyacid dehydrogenase [Aliiglaciecola sp. 2_MG-2023]|uniref:D-2-hydroxyacid dehydrogenase n=1 Tax=unclassified Aliiglaciecola TaxID=2593648 RepID=UPI0026E23CED|nr:MULTISPECIES: D-2-hydroxyacid dehydrogenase [unclassified Aliiglaciecola]MDO6712467.1 D-2-hydroxyacid dehydrogenase [Aliiglaciecola sp. 2_MG-2023]MDO6753475.1 D-2-hydroxyacid dehydrogenase [Aliiglaciecola sp. 1_MG-2023]